MKASALSRSFLYVKPLLIILNLSLIPYISRLLAIPPQILNPLIIFFSIIGVYLVSFNTFDIQMMVFITLMAVGLKMLDFPMAPMLLGFILGGMLEKNLSRALVVSDGSFDFLWNRPLTLSIMCATITILLLPGAISFIKRIGSKGLPSAD